MTRSSDQLQPVAASTAGPSIRWRKLFWPAVVIGFLLRLGLSAAAQGTVDAATWRGFGKLISQVGLFDAYRQNSDLNHPPLMALWAYAVWRVTRSQQAFSFVFRLLPIAADGLACAVLFRVGGFRGRPGRARWDGRAMAAAMALNPVAILVSAYHGNTDNVYAALSLLAACLLWRGRPLWGGVVLGAAINVKIIPVILILPLLAACYQWGRTLGQWAAWRAPVRMVLGLMLGTIPFVPLLVVIPRTVKHNMFDYNSSVYAWGVMYVLTDAAHRINLPWLAAWEGPYRTIGRRAILAASGLIAVAAFARPRRWDPVQLATFVYAAFLVVTPGFGVQYTACVVPMLILAFPRHAAAYGTAAGVFLLANYAFAPNGRWAASPIAPDVYALGLVMGVVAWLVLVTLLLKWLGGLKDGDGSALVRPPASTSSI